MTDKVKLQGRAGCRIQGRGGEVSAGRRKGSCYDIPVIEGVGRWGSSRRRLRTWSREFPFSLWNCRPAIG